MKLIVAVIWPDKLEAVQSVLSEPEACLMSVSQVVGGRALTETYRGAKVQVLQPRLRLEIAVVNDTAVRDIVTRVASAAAMENAKKLGSGNIMVLELEEHVSIPCGNCEE